MNACCTGYGYDLKGIFSIRYQDTSKRCLLYYTKVLLVYK